jgi:energy-coupling factor transporter ATP-binding protein EcfA2
VPQGREIFPLLTVRENLETGYAGLKRGDKTIPDYIFTLFPVLKSMLGRRGGDLSGGQQQQLAIGRALVTRPKVLVLDEPTEGIQPSIIRDIGRALQFLRDEKGMTILLVEQYLDFCREIAGDIYIMDHARRPGQRPRPARGPPPSDGVTTRPSLRRISPLKDANIRFWAASCPSRMRVPLDDVGFDGAGRGTREFYPDEGRGAGRSRLADFADACCIPKLTRTAFLDEVPDRGWAGCGQYRTTLHTTTRRLSRPGAARWVPSSCARSQPAQ